MDILILIIVSLLMLIAHLLVKINNLSALIKIDGLTQLFNKRQFEHDYFNTSYKRATDPKYLIIVDVNNFKLINDTHGHNFGDEHLKTIAKDLLNNIRQNDKVYRIGGDEFAILTTHKDLASRLKSNVISISVGVAKITTNKVKSFNEADTNMYNNKRGL